ncbi:hypothetical protein CDD80_5987 [Ophiocordyceps camponoti-rufipedis]|uniref:TOM core complex subunit Tom6 n=1 Tax=Ophiocordyceps camponoti-rufipedis TaxID=2004952 RepID=A0A2C5XX94_9HYPO|nr:hypothetical protein CDD80_5987 [Ophiocordyceps camponoti-rufipedis]
MAPKRQINVPPPRRAQRGYFTSVYETLTAPENASVVRSIAMFGAAVAFLASPWSSILLPPWVSIRKRWPFSSFFYS